MVKSIITQALLVLLASSASINGMLLVEQPATPAVHEHFIPLQAYQPRSTATPVWSAPTPLFDEQELMLQQALLDAFAAQHNQAAQPQPATTEQTTPATNDLLAQEDLDLQRALLAQFEHTSGTQSAEAAPELQASVDIQPDANSADQQELSSNASEVTAAQPRVTQEQLQTPARALNVRTRDWGPAFDGIKKLFGQVTKDRADLKDMRETNIAAYKNAITQPAPDYMRITQDITTDTIAFINERIAQTIRKLGPAPTQFSVFSMGSMARDESGFYTDLEIGILVKEKNMVVDTYFKRFAQILADRLFLLGEHPDVGGKGLRMDEADNSPVHLKWFARYASEQQQQALLQQALVARDFSKIPFEGGRIFVATPTEFARHVDPTFLIAPSTRLSETERHALIKQELARARKNPANKRVSTRQLCNRIARYIKQAYKPLSAKEKRISDSTASLVRNTRHLYGNQAIFEQYLQQREVYLNGQPKYDNKLYTTRREEIAYINMRADLLKAISNPKSAIVTGQLGSEVDLKREIYRFPEQILTNLGFMYDVGAQNTVEIARRLVDAGVMSQQLSEQLIDTMNFCIGLRLKKQEKLRKQGYAIPVTAEEHTAQQEELLEELNHLCAGRDMLVESGAPEAEIAALDQKISETRAAIKELDKTTPLEPTSILSPDEIELLNTTYLPVLKELFLTAQAFIQGDKSAFLRNTHRDSVTAPDAATAVVTTA